MGREVRQYAHWSRLPSAADVRKLTSQKVCASLAAVGLLRGAISVQSHVAPARVPLFHDALGLVAPARNAPRWPALAASLYRMPVLRLMAKSSTLAHPYPGDRSRCRLNIKKSGDG
jgi:hypothetical protein